MVEGRMLGTLEPRWIMITFHARREHRCAASGSGKAAQAAASTDSLDQARQLPRLQSSETKSYLSLLWLGSIHPSEAKLIDGVGLSIVFTSQCGPS